MESRRIFLKRGLFADGNDSTARGKLEHMI
jgi:hypothetical protein